MSTQFRSDDTVKWWKGFGDGSDGDLTVSSDTTEAPIDASCSGTSGASTLSATNASFAIGQAILIHQTRGTGAGNWQLNEIVGYTAGTITLKQPLAFTCTDSGASQAQVRVLKQYNNVTVNSGITWTAKAWNGDVGGILAFLAKGTVTITGNIVSRSAFTGGRRGTVFGVNSTGEQGENRGGTQSQSSNQNNGGGGGGTVRTTNEGGHGGGGGAFGANGSNGASAGAGGTVGQGGTAYGVAELTTLFFGAGGGGGGVGDNTSSGGTGGRAGGIVCIFAKNVVVGGTINVSGNNGVTGGGDQGSGGGGAGGAILVKAKTADFGTTKLTASAGAGGTGGGANGGNGAVGRIHLDYSGSFTGTTSPTLDSRLDSTIRARRGGGALYTHFL